MPHLGRVPLEKLTPAAIQDSYRRLQDELADYSVLQVHRTLNRALSQALHWELTRRNPAHLVYQPRPKPRAMTALAPDELRRPLNTSRDDRLHPALVLLMGG
jgi:integrase